MKDKIKHFLKNHAYQGIPLTFDEAYDLGSYALTGCHGDQSKEETRLAQIQSIAVLSALHNIATYAWKNNGGVNHTHRLPANSAEQIASICAAIFEKDIKPSKFGYLEPKVEYSMDNSGMGGDLVVTANVSTIAALIASAAGIKICKHGSPANADTGHHGSSDFIELIGIHTYASKDEVQKCVEDEGFGYTEALDKRYKVIHDQTHKVAMIPHMNDIIGPITNPLHPDILTRRVLGVNHLITPRIVAEVYKILNERGYTNVKHGIFVRGYIKTGSYEGMDEISICEGGTQVAELKKGVITEYHIKASDFGLTPVSQLSISPPNKMSKGEFSLRILKGDISGPPLQMVLANAAILFYLAGRSADLKKCYKLALAVHKKGGAYKKAMTIKNRLPLKRGAK